MAAPVVEYYSKDGATKLTNWAIGEVDAGTSSPLFEVKIWNNKAMAEGISEMKNSQVTVVDENGGTAGTPSEVVVKQRWVNVVSANGKDLTQPVSIGGEDSFPIHADGVDDADKKHIVSGDKTDGSLANSVKNYSSLGLKVVVPANAEAGQRPFRVRTKYSYT